MESPHLTLDERKSLILSLGTHKSRRLLSPKEVSEILARVHRNGMKVKELAEQIQLGTTMVTKFIRMADLRPELRDLVSWGNANQNSTISFTVATELSRLDPDDQIVVFRAATEHRLSQSEMVKIVQLRERSKSELEDCLSEVIQQRPTHNNHHMIIGDITDPSLTEQLQSVSQSSRDRLLRDVITELVHTQPMHAALGPKRFSLGGNRDLAISIKNLGDFEKVVTNELRAHM